MQTVAETSIFAKKAAMLLSEDERAELISYLAQNPDAGDEIKGTGGVRKMRFKAKGKGKSGGVRVIYYFFNKTIPLYALTIYGKNEKADLSAEEKKIVSALAARIKATAKKKEA
ncbi:MAG: addiction module toxin RelE [Parvibaculum sp.]|nr:addiction module toxin RelE [Parvibaculum sp.]